MTTILVVEDEPTLAELLKETLDIEGYHTVTFLNGEDAIQFAFREMPQLIILDIMLPGIDGYEVVKQLREHPKTLNTPIIALSACMSHSDKTFAFELGVDNYITKPFDTNELLALIRRQLKRVQQGSLSPLTMLPGGLQLEHAISSKLNSQEPWSILYLDFDNFKAFNDVYGFIAGNSMILLLGQVCQRVIYEFGNVTDFAGHIGGDDFLIMTTPDKAHLLCMQILERYKLQSKTLYRHEDLERGSISGVDRKGRAYQFPLVSISIGVVNNQQRQPHNLDEVSLLVAEAKRNAKLSNESVFAVSSRHAMHYPDIQDKPRKNSTDFQPSLSLMHMQHARRFSTQDAYVEF